MGLLFSAQGAAFSKRRWLLVEIRHNSLQVVHMGSCNFHYSMYTCLVSFTGREGHAGRQHQQSETRKHWLTLQFKTAPLSLSGRIVSQPKLHLRCVLTAHEEFATVLQQELDGQRFHCTAMTIQHHVSGVVLPHPTGVQRVRSGAQRARR